ncbi:MAG: leucyl/phenylalanyl-tRNA--protein transferase [Alphaproteobacteria bacterium]
MEKLDLDLLLKAYCTGFFPMAETRDATEVFWVDPPERGVFLPDSFHVPKKLKKLIGKFDYEFRLDTAFEQVMLNCGAQKFGREDTWICPQIVDAYTELHHRGFGHSFEIWRDDQLIGGLYGLQIGAAFFGESMFGAVSGASKIVLVEAAARLFSGGIKLFDTQFWTEHLDQFGCLEIEKENYLDLLGPALMQSATIQQSVSAEQFQAFLQSTTHTS